MRFSDLALEQEFGHCFAARHKQVDLFWSVAVVVANVFLAQAYPRVPLSGFTSMAVRTSPLVTAAADALLAVYRGWPRQLAAAQAASVVYGSTREPIMALHRLHLVACALTWAGRGLFNVFDCNEMRCAFTAVCFIPIVMAFGRPQLFRHYVWFHGFLTLACLYAAVLAPGGSSMCHALAQQPYVPASCWLGGQPEACIQVTAGAADVSALSPAVGTCLDSDQSHVPEQCAFVMQRVVEPAAATLSLLANAMPGLLPVDSGPGDSPFLGSCKLVRCTEMAGAAPPHMLQAGDQSMAAAATNASAAGTVLGSVRGRLGSAAGAALLARLKRAVGRQAGRLACVWAVEGPAMEPPVQTSSCFCGYTSCVAVSAFLLLGPGFVLPGYLAFVAEMHARCAFLQHQGVNLPGEYQQFYIAHREHNPMLAHGVFVFLVKLYMWGLILSIWWLSLVLAGLQIAHS